MIDSSREPRSDRDRTLDYQPAEVADVAPPPFVHCFATASQKYVFDVNTRRILRVPAVAYELLSTGLVERSVRELEAAYGSEASRAACQQIRTAQRNGLFLSVRPRRVVIPRAAEVEEALRTKRQQLVLNVTENCNFRCSYCLFGGGYRHQRTHSTQSMDWETAKAAIDDFLAHSEDASDRTVSFYGGEPLLMFPLVRQCVSYLRKHHRTADVRFAMTVNGSLLKGEVADFLAKHAFSISVSLDGPSEVHDRQRHTRDGSGTWEAIVRNIEAFLEAHPKYRSNSRLRFSAVATAQTDLSEVDAYFSSSPLFTRDMDLGLVLQRTQGARVGAPAREGPLQSSFRRMRLQFLDDLRSGQYQAQQGSPSTWVQRALFEKPFIMLHKRKFLTPHLPAETALLPTCVPGVRRTFVSVSGEYFACERVVPCPAQYIGDVQRGVSSKRVLALLDRWHRKVQHSCRDCWCLPICNVGCFATIGENGTISSSEAREACALNRQRMDQLLRDYCSVLEENPHAFDYAEAYEFQ